MRLLERIPRRCVDVGWLLERWFYNLLAAARRRR